MARRRLGVALLVPPPAAAEVDGLRRACGDNALGRVPPHITLVPPVNVREEQVGDALDVLRAAAATTGPLTLELGPAASFAPVSPVAYLAVRGALDGLHALRDAVFHRPLARDLTHSFVPHVTLTVDIDEAKASAIVTAMADYRATVMVDRVHLLEEGPGHVWSPIADASLGTPVMVGRGGLPLALDESSELDDEGRALVEREWPLVLLDAHGPAALVARAPFAITARREAAPVGVVEGWTSGGLAFVDRLVVAAGARGQGIGTRLVLATEDLARRRGCASVALDALAGSAAEEFYRGRGFGREGGRTAWVNGADLVQLRRSL